MIVEIDYNGKTYRSKDDGDDSKLEEGAEKAYRMIDKGCGAFKVHLEGGGVLVMSGKALDLSVIKFLPND